MPRIHSHLSVLQGQTSCTVYKPITSNSFDSCCLTKSNKLFWTVQAGTSRLPHMFFTFPQMSDITHSKAPVMS